MSAVWVQTPEQARIAAELEAKATTVRLQEVPQPPAWAPFADPGPSAARPDLHPVTTPPGLDELAPVDELLALHARGELEPAPVELGPMPVWATPPMRAIAADFQLRVALLAAEGVFRALPYAASVGMKAAGIKAKRSAGYALDCLCGALVIRHVGEMAPISKGSGTKLYVPADWWPIDPDARAIVEATGRHPRAADLVWMPDGFGGAA